MTDGVQKYPCHDHTVTIGRVDPNCEDCMNALREEIAVIEGEEPTMGKKGERTYDDPSDDPDQKGLFEFERESDASLRDYEEETECDADD